MHVSNVLILRFEQVIGSYEDVMDTCRRGHLQPQVLFYEASKR
jgi:hypothetical protein